MPEQTPLQTLFDTLPQTGRVEWIGILPAPGEAMEALDSVAITPGKLENKSVPVSCPATAAGYT